MPPAGSSPSIVGRQANQRRHEQQDEQAEQHDERRASTSRSPGAGARCRPARRSRARTRAPAPCRTARTAIAGVRVRRPMSASWTGNAPGPMPHRTIQTAVPCAGDEPQPEVADDPAATNRPPTGTGCASGRSGSGRTARRAARGSRTRRASARRPRCRARRPRGSAAATRTSRTCRWCWRRTSSTSAQPSRERHTSRDSAAPQRTRSGRPVGLRRSSQDLAQVRARGHGAGSRRRATARSPRPRRRPTSPPTQRQPAACATGSATSGGTAVLTDSATEYDAVTAPMRSGKYRFTSGGSSTLPMPMPPSASTDQPRNTGVFGATARRSCPTTTNTIARIDRRLEPEACARSARRACRTARTTRPGWCRAARPASSRRGTSRRTWLKIGETAATASRRLRPTSTMAARTTRRPRHGATRRPVTGRTSTR